MGAKGCKGGRKGKGGGKNKAKCVCCAPCRMTRTCKKAGGQCIKSPEICTGTPVENGCKGEGCTCWVQTCHQRPCHLLEMQCLSKVSSTLYHFFLSCFLRILIWFWKISYCFIGFTVTNLSLVSYHFE